MILFREVSVGQADRPAKAREVNLKKKISYSLAYSWP